MELTFQKTSINCLETVLCDSTNLEQTQEVKLPDAMPDIGRVIASFAQVTIRAKEWTEGSICVSGGVMAWVLYAGEDGSGTRCIDTWIPFQMRWDIPAGTPEGEISVCVALRSIDARSVSPRKLMLRANVTASVQAFSPQTILIPKAEGEAVELLSNTTPVCLMREAGEKSFLIDEELTAPNAEKLLTYTLSIQITDQKVMANKVVFRGNATAHVRYLDTSGALCCTDLDLPISQFAELDGELTPDADAFVTAFITSLEADLSDGGKLHLKAGICAQYRIDERIMLTYPQDAYSPTREIALQIEAFSIPCLLDAKYERVTCEQSAPADAQTIVDAVFYPEYPHVRIMDGTAQIAMQGVFYILYQAEDGTLRACAPRWEGSVTLPVAENVCVCALPTSVQKPQVRIGDGKLEVRTDMELFCRAEAKTEHSAISALDLGEERTPDPARPSIILRRAGGDSLWTIAKSCGSTVDAIRQINAISDAPAPNELLIIPVK